MTIPFVIQAETLWRTEGVALFNCGWKTGINWGCPLHARTGHMVAPWTPAHENRRSPFCQLGQVW